MEIQINGTDKNSNSYNILITHFDNSLKMLLLEAITIALNKYWANKDSILNAYPENLIK